MSIDNFLLPRFRTPVHKSQIAALQYLLPAKFDVAKRLKFLLMQAAVTLPIDPLKLFC
jgi:hypothetical protein